jgi:hypothetical protein
MRLRSPLHGVLCSTAIVLLGFWMAVTTVSVSGRWDFQLQVPATYLSVGQEFQARLLSLAPTPAAPPASITLQLTDARGRVLGTQRLRLDAAGEVEAAPLALPGAGEYALQARAGKKRETIRLHAMPEPDGSYGGVLALAAAGLPGGASDYLRQHGFAVTELDGVAPPTRPRMIVIGDARLDGNALAMQYRWIWRQVALGAQVLALEPPAAGAAAYWPAIGPLSERARGCVPSPTADAPLYYGLRVDAGLRAMLAPSVDYRVTPAAAGVFAWDGERLEGAGDCQAVFSLRYGHGWITVSTLPLLQHFQDVRARLMLMNLIKAAALRKHYQLSTDLTAAALAKRLAGMPAADAAADAAVYFEPPPAAVAPTPLLLPLGGGGCWRAPVMLRPGASVRLDLHRPQAVHTLTLRFGPGGDGRPVAYTLAASPDGTHWTALAAPPQREVTLALGRGNWQAFRLGLPVATSGWELCGFSAH